MLASLVLVAALWGPPVPGEGLALAPDPVRPPVGALPISVPAAPIGVAIGGGVVAALAIRKPKQRGSRSPEPLYVFVPGHGGSGADFADLVAAMGIDPEQAIVFDYRWAYPSPDPELASQRAPSADAADALHVALAVLARDHQAIYVVGHSKGGAVITELIARWDAVPTLGVAAVRGAALLDPAIAAGGAGDLQRIGGLFDDVADNGGFDPVRCGWLHCRDVRVDLGEASGVEVVAIRNPDALITNFDDEPAGLRVYDLDDQGPSPLDRPWDLSAALTRIRQAHASVLHSEVVAACIVAEATVPGSCVWPRAVSDLPRPTGHPGGPFML